MKIIVLNYADTRVELVDVPEHMVENDNIDAFLFEHGFYHQGLCSWMVAPIDYVPVNFHKFNLDKNTMEEVHEVRKARLKDFSIYDSVQETKRREREELREALRHHGESVDGGYEYHFDGECPIIAAYCYDEPCDVVVLAVRVDKQGVLSIRVDEKLDRGNEFELDPDNIFAGQLSFITSEIQ